MSHCDKMVFDVVHLKGHELWYENMIQNLYLNLSLTYHINPKPYPNTKLMLETLKSKC